MVFSFFLFVWVEGFFFSLWVFVCFGVWFLGGVFCLFVCVFLLSEWIHTMTL